jgi:hypothetical protein
VAAFGSIEDLMLVFAHAGHWLVQLIYLVPLAVLVTVIMVGRARDRREEARKAKDAPQE